MSTATLSLKTAAILDEASLLVDAIPEKTITVCHPVWSLEAGGLERQMLQILGGQSSERFHHLVVARQSSDARTINELPDNIELICQDGPQRDLLWSRRLAALLDEHDVNVLHLRGLTMLTDGVLAAQFAGHVRTVMSFHGFETSPPRVGPIKRRVLRWAMGRCDARWAVSASAAGAIATELNMDDGDFDIVCNGVDTVHFAPFADRESVRRRLGLPTDRPIILSVGNLKPIKSHHVLLEAFAHLPASVSGATLVLVGQDYMNGQLQRFAATHLRGRDVRFVGRQADAAHWYQAADLFVLPSHYEGMSNALLEAMACGLPVIATSVGGNCDVIEHDRTGLLVAPRCADSLAGAMTRLLTEKIWRDQLGAAARRHVLYNFDIRDTRADYERRYEALAGRAENHE